MRKRIIWLGCFSLLMLGIASCSGRVAGKEVTKLSVWPTYWETDGVLAEIEQIQGNIDNICYFAAYFDKEGQPFIPKESLQTFEQVKKNYQGKGFKHYLTFVNDLILSEDTSSLKDTKLLYTLLAEKEERRAHIKQILSLTKENGFDGIEIDYEAIDKDNILWGYFAQFLEELMQEAKKDKILVRIVLEPNVPIDELQLPKGPEYVLMCYNLYGYGTEPGPKADQEFLIQMIDVMEKMPAPRNMALSVGGFDFAENGQIAQKTEAACDSLRRKVGKLLYRDKSSGDLVFSYTDEKGKMHEVWYADSETLSYWIKIGKKHGIHRFSIWRLGDNISLSDCAIS